MQVKTSRASAIYQITHKLYPIIDMCIDMKMKVKKAYNCDLRFNGSIPQN